MNASPNPKYRCQLRIYFTINGLGFDFRESRNCEVELKREIRYATGVHHALEMTEGSRIVSGENLWDPGVSVPSGKTDIRLSR